MPLQCTSSRNIAPIPRPKKATPYARASVRREELGHMQCRSLNNQVSRLKFEFRIAQCNMHKNIIISLQTFTSGINKVEADIY